MVDKYGVAYLLSARLVGIVLVFGVEHALSMGLDLRSWIDAIGLGVVGACVVGAHTWPVRTAGVNSHCLAVSPVPPGLMMVALRMRMINSVCVSRW